MLPFELLLYNKNHNRQILAKFYSGQSYEILIQIEVNTLSLDLVDRRRFGQGKNRKVLGISFIDQKSFVLVDACSIYVSSLVSVLLLEITHFLSTSKLLIIIVISTFF